MLEKLSKLNIKLSILIFIVFTAIAKPSVAQEEEDSVFNMMDTLLFKTGIKNAFRIKAFNADEQMYSENFDGAIKILKELVKEAPNNYNVNFKLGYCYLKTSLEKHKAIQYLEKAVQGASRNYIPEDLMDTLAPLESYYFLGKAYHINYQFQEAIDTLKYLR
ncbi:MAG: hypothetical protein C0594_16330 [Marinilabiliales bacterium]|nr:MAG: hypothetical protein C0594_16330 [Marinilabiliales bacterium]